MYENILGNIKDISTYEVDIDSTGLEGFVQTPLMYQNHPAMKYGLLSESILENADVVQKLQAYQQNMRSQDNQECPEHKLHICTMDHKSFRIYFDERTALDSNYYQNKFHTFISSLSSEHTVTIMMGSGLGRWFNDIAIGNIIFSIMSAKCNVITKAIGRCGTSESFIWLYGKERHLTRYASLEFYGVHSLLKQFSVYKHYFSVLFNKAKELNLLTDEQVEELMTSNKFLSLVKKDIQD